MRPSVLFPLFASVGSLTGIGARLGKLLEKAAGGRLIDLVLHVPVGLVDRRHSPKIAEAVEGSIATIEVTVDRHMPPGNPRLPYKVRCRDETGYLYLIFFRPRAEYLKTSLPQDAVRIVSGRVERFRDEIQMTHPDHIASAEDFARLAAVEPVYRLTAGLTPNVMRKAVQGALARLPSLPEWQDSSLLARERWPSWGEAIRVVHAPAEEADLSAAAPIRRRLAYDELLATQLALALVRNQVRRLPGRSIAGDGRLRRLVSASLPFRLTASQEVASREIENDMGSGARMLRLLQGDVGSGKTVVALFAMLNAAETGAQAALMAPTELLARQHFNTIEPLANAAGVKAVLLTGRDKGKTRQAIIDDLSSGNIGLLIGTHALFQEDVDFHDLALVVIDEQHRFGVHQRLDLTAKGPAAHVLVTTATPIPRTLALAAYGDMDISRLTEKPPGRQPIDTRTVPLSRLQEVVAGVARETARGAKVYWVCPLVEDSEAIDLSNAVDRHAALTERFGKDRVGLVHGRMPSAEKDRAMASFAGGKVNILVATTVIEVGVDVPTASVMVIEHAERFGLAQLHQLRGRVGRGARRSTAVLLYASPLSETARARLKVLRDTEDGFVIAEEDLRLRGAGEVLGTRQSGLPEFRLADIAAHADLVAIARDDARLTVDRDPELTSARGEALRTLLYLFEQDAAVRRLRSG